jgi:MFS family permease
MPCLRAELHLSYTIAAMHFSAPATGALLAGMIGDRVVSRLGRARTIWCGGIGVVIGVLIALSGTTATATIFGAWLIGFTGSQMCQTITALMSDRFKDERAVAITESNIVASIFCALAPLIVSAVVRNGLNWRAALIPSMVLFIILGLTNRQTVQAGTVGNKPHLQPGSLPPAYWAFFVVILLSVSSEWSLIFWSAEFLEKIVHLTKPDAAAGVSVFLTAMFSGRIIGSRLTRVLSTKILLPIAATLAAAGFLVFWQGTTPWVNLAGLFVAGLGEANIYPLSLSSAIGVAPEQSARATARMSMSSGLAVLSAPLIMGVLADHGGIGNAYGLVAILLILACFTVLVANTMATRHHAVRPKPLVIEIESTEQA